jgi:SMC interacting uncharacterized protein involved in chromosome segregation
MSKFDHFVEARKSDIRRLEQNMALMDDARDGIQARLHKLYELMQEKDQQIEQLQWMVDMLLSKLDQAGIVNSREIAKEWREFQSLTQPSEQTPSEPSILCARCTSQIPVSQSYFSDRGEVCFPCFERIQAIDEEGF